MNPGERPSGEGSRSWNDWYRFALDELGLGHDECADYANHRVVEVENRKHLRREPTRRPAA